MSNDHVRRRSRCALYGHGFTGTGKTLTTIAVMGRLFQDGYISRALIVAPSSVCPVWPSELAKFAGFPCKVSMLLGSADKRKKLLEQLAAPAPGARIAPLQIGVINYEGARIMTNALLAFKPDFIACDESQRIKNHSAQQSKALHKLGDIARYKLILTGTPITQDVRDVWSQYRFLDQSIFGKSFYPFQMRYANIDGFHRYLGPRNLDELTRKMHAVAYRVTKEQCLDLPEKLFEERVVELPDKARALYRRIAKESYAALESGGEVTASIVLTRLLRLQQLSGGFLTDDDGKTTQQHTAKLDATTDIVQSLCIDEGKKLVIFARFRAEIEALREAVDKLLHINGLKQVTIYGGVPLDQRGQIVEQFQTDPDTRVLIGQIDSCAEGVTLTSASVILYHSLTFNLAKYLQSQDRIHRIGQADKCLYIHLVVPGTIDTKIIAALKKKEELAHSVVDNWRALFSEEGDDEP